MGTKIYGVSDDLIEFEGDVSGEVNCYGTDDQERGVLVICSDGTLLEVQYCKNIPGVWAVVLLNKGSLFAGMKHCTDSDEDPYSDVAIFNDGLKWAYYAHDGGWGQVS